MWWSIVCALLGMTFIGGFGWCLAFLIPGIHDLRKKRSLFFRGITAEVQPVRYWLGVVAWFGLALLTLTFAIGLIP